MQNLGVVKQAEGAPRYKTPIYDGYWTGEAVLECHTAAEIRGHGFHSV